MKAGSNKNYFKYFLYAYIAFLLLFYVIPKTSMYQRFLFYIPYGIKLNNDNLVLVKGENYRLYVVAINKRVSYSSTDFKVAYVNLNGRVYAKRAGVAFIEARVGGKVLKCKVRVLSINRKNLTLSVGESFTLRVNGDGLFNYISWKSSNHEVVSVNRYGFITARSKGKAIITAKTKGKKLTCIVYVE